MSDLINLPSTANRTDFAAHLSPGEVNGGVILTTESGKRYVSGSPGEFPIGARVVTFARVVTGGRRSSVHAGWQKIDTKAVITGVGSTYTRDGETLANHYVSEQA